MKAHELGLLIGKARTTDTIIENRNTDFNSSFETNSLSKYAVVFHAETVSFTNDPLGSGARVIKMSVPDTATGPTENVRCQLQPPANILPDMELWFGVAVLFPSGTGPTIGDAAFPSMPETGTSGWFNICQLYQSNPESSAAIKLGFRIAEGDRLYWQRNATYGSDRPWAGELIERDKWYEFAWHVFTSADESLGYAELWMNDGNGWVQQTFFVGTSRQTTRVYMKTLDPIATTNGPNRFDIQAYRKVGMFPFVVDTYFGPHKVGSSLAEVDPGMYT
jgi:hypothetical protein